MCAVSRRCGLEAWVKTVRANAGSRLVYSHQPQGCTSHTLEGDLGHGPAGRQMAGVIRLTIVRDLSLVRQSRGSIRVSALRTAADNLDLLLERPQPALNGQLSFTATATGIAMQLTAPSHAHLPKTCIVTVTAGRHDICMSPTHWQSPSLAGGGSGCTCLGAPVTTRHHMRSDARDAELGHPRGRRETRRRGHGGWARFRGDRLSLGGPQLVGSSRLSSLKRPGMECPGQPYEVQSSEGAGPGRSSGLDPIFRAGGQGRCWVSLGMSRFQAALLSPTKEARRRHSLSAAGLAAVWK